MARGRDRPPKPSRLVRGIVEGRPARSLTSNPARAGEASPDREPSGGRTAPVALALAVVFGQLQGAHGAASQNSASHRMRTHMVSLVGRSDTDQDLGQRVVAYALRHQGSQVGDGECFSLADAALHSAGARSAASYEDITPDADYVWGNPVRLSDVHPGDILQFHNFHIRRRILKTMQVPGGGSMSQEGEELEERDHHTAIVERNFGGTLSILEQNVEPYGRVVQRRQIEIASTVFHATDQANANVLTTTEVWVDGEVRAYRPQKFDRGS